jgi:uncharacterized membrane protein
MEAHEVGATSRMWSSKEGKIRQYMTFIVPALHNFLLVPPCEAVQLVAASIPW